MGLYLYICRITDVYSSEMCGAACPSYRMTAGLVCSVAPLLQCPLVVAYTDILALWRGGPRDTRRCERTSPHIARILVCRPGWTQNAFESGKLNLTVMRFWCPLCSASAVRGKSAHKSVSRTGYVRCCPRVIIVRCFSNWSSKINALQLVTSHFTVTSVLLTFRDFGL